uniref:TPR_REGION domain-containing protein n=1 Tax=Syphacia muris TaxID=451379 RepID=A0A0N5A9M8_9BILA
MDTKGDTEATDDEQGKSSVPEETDACSDLLDSLTLTDIQDFKERGNEKFRIGNYTEAINWYTKGLEKYPNASTSDRATLLSNRAATHMKLLNWESAITDCSLAIELGAPNEKALERRAISYSMIDEKIDSAVEDYQSLSNKFPERKRYKEKLNELKKKSDERKAKMTEEFVGQLKGLGNMFLRPFGLSTDDFTLEKDPGGNYTIKTKR